MASFKYLIKPSKSFRKIRSNERINRPTKKKESRSSFRVVFTSRRCRSAGQDDVKFVIMIDPQEGYVTPRGQTVFSSSETYVMTRNDVYSAMITSGDESARNVGTTVLSTPRNKPMIRFVTPAFLAAIRKYGIPLGKPVEASRTTV